MSPNYFLGNWSWQIKNLSLALLLIIFSSCTKNDVAGGAGGETTNGISGLIVDENGKPQANVNVKIIPVNYDPIEYDSVNPILESATDEYGSYNINNLNPGNYNLVASHPDNISRVIISNLAVDDEKIYANVGILKPTGSITIAINAFQLEDGGYLYIPGTDVYIQIDSQSIENGFIILDFIPAGNISEIIYQKEIIGPKSNLLLDTQVVNPKDSLVIGTSNVMGKVLKENGTPSSGVIIKLIPANFNPILDQLSDSLVRISDVLGVFQFEIIFPGEYRLEAVDINSGLKHNIPITSFTGDTVNLGEFSLKNTGSIRVFITDSLINSYQYVLITNSCLFVELDSSVNSKGYFDIGGIPIGTYPSLQLLPNAKSIQGVPWLDSLQIISGRNLRMGPFAGWKHTQKVSLNTGLLNPGIQSNIFNIPVLVRVPRGIIPESEFSTPPIKIFATEETNIILPVQYGGASDTHHLFWVKLKTLNSKVSEQNQVYLYIKEQVNYQKQSVFDSGNGYKGVWPLNSNSLEDVSLPANHGTNFNAEVVEGVISNALFFDNLDFATLPAAAFSGITESISVSLWINGNDPIKIPSTMVFEARTEEGAAGNRVFAAHVPKEDTLVVLDAGIEPGQVLRIQKTASDPLEYKGRWNHWCFVRNGSSGNMIIYLNGKIWHQEQSQTGPLQPIGDFKLGTYIHATESYDGSMDEFRVSDLVRSQDWIRFSYENQKQGSQLVIIE